MRLKLETYGGNKIPAWQIAAALALLLIPSLFVG